MGPDGSDGVGWNELCALSHAPSHAPLHAPSQHTRSGPSAHAPLARPPIGRPARIMHISDRWPE